MNVTRSAHSIISSQIVKTLRLRALCRNLQTTPKPCAERRRRRITSIKAEDMGLIEKQNRSLPAEELFPTYDADDKENLKKIYTKEQLAAIEAGEAAIDIEDLKTQGKIRSDMGRLQYFDDLSVSRAALDRKKEYEGPYDPDLREANIQENVAAVLEAAEKVLSKVPEGSGEEQPKVGQNYLQSSSDESDEKFKPIISRMNVWKIQDTMSLAMGKDGPISRDHGQMQDFTAPGLPRKFLPRERKAQKEEENDVRDPDGVYNRLIAQTGLTLDEILAYKIKVLVQHRVSNQTRLGKIPGQYVLAIAGNGNGTLGLGQAKGSDGGQTLNLAKISAIKNMQPIPRYEDRTIFGEVDAKVSAVKVKLMSRPPGFGLRCQHLIFEMARAAGIQDLAARVPHARNKMNTCKAVYKALLNQPIPDEIARGRGKKLVDVRKVYYCGQV